MGAEPHRVGAEQWFPWPTKLSAGGQAAGLEARAAQRGFEAHALELAAAVASAYWELWRAHRQQAVLRDELEVLTSLSEQIRVRLEVGRAELSDLAQIGLLISRTRDRLAGFEDTLQIASARLVWVTGAPDGTATPVSESGPAVAELDEPLAALTAAALSHPRIESLAHLSDASRRRVVEARAERLPSFGLGVDWVITGKSGGDTPPPQSGRDALALSFSVKVPLWARAYSAAENEARARGAAYRARTIAMRNELSAVVRQQVAKLRGDVRRARTYKSTLLPQAQTAFESVLNSYAAGRSRIADLLMAEKELLALRDELYIAESDYGIHLAELESVVGRVVVTKGLTDGER